MAKRVSRDDDWGFGERAQEPAGQPLVPIPAPASSPLDLSGVSPDIIARAQEAMEAEWASTSRRGYERGWECFKVWVRAVGIGAFCPAAPETVALYLTTLAEIGVPARGRRKGKAGYSMATLRHARASIAWGHYQAGMGTPTAHPRIRGLMKGLDKKHGDPPRRAKPIMPEHLVAIIAWLRHVRDPLCFLRDRAILLGGFAGAFRRAELVALRREDVRVTPGGVLFRLQRQQGEHISEVKKGTKAKEVSEIMPVDFTMDPALVGMGICPVEALREWMQASASSASGLVIEELPFIRALREDDGLDDVAPIQDRPMSARKVSRLVIAGVKAVGLNPKDYSGHSLRAGLATYWIYVLGKNRFEVRDHLRHKSIQMLEKYVRDWDELPREGLI